jgi:hypothetical protein
LKKEVLSGIGRLPTVGAAYGLPIHRFAAPGIVEGPFMSLRDAILSCAPVSYWPLDDAASATTVHDEMGRHAGAVPGSGVNLALVPFGPILAPVFDGAQGSLITIPDDERYSQTYAKALTMASWICPLALNFAYTDGSTDQYVHVVEKAVGYDQDAEWALRLYNADSGRPSRLSFYLFNAGSPVGKGAGSYMQCGLSANDQTPVELRRWLFLVGQAEPWIDDTSQLTGAILYKQAIQAIRSPGDKYNNPPSWNVHPHHSSGPIAIGGSIDKTAFRGAVAHVALWDRLLTVTEIEGIWSAGQAELRVTPMYGPY